MVYFIIWEMHGFTHQFPTVQENATKPIAWGEPEKLVLILFLYGMGVFFPLDSHSMVYFITWEMYVFSHHLAAMGKGSQIHRMGKVWEIGSWEYPTKSIVLRKPGKLALLLFA